jgi:hypothetical protein
MAQSNYILNFEGMSTYNDNKALIKSTGEVYRVKNMYAKYSVEVTLNFGDDSLMEIMKSYKSEIIFKSDDIPDILKNNDFSISNYDKKEGCNQNVFYLLEDGNSYNECDLIVGADNIRESKLNNLLDNGVQ